MQQQIISFQELYNAVNDGGVYLCEDNHTSYWKRYGAGYKQPHTFIEYTKNLIDKLHAYHSETSELQVNWFTENTIGIHYYDSIVVFDKKKRNKPSAKTVGIKTIF